MTEEEWLAADDPPGMLAHLGERATTRKLHRLAVEMVRPFESLSLYPVVREAFAYADALADGRADPSRREAVLGACVREAHEDGRLSGSVSSLDVMVEALLAADVRGMARSKVAMWHTGWWPADDPAVRAGLGPLILDIFGNPFHLDPRRPGWWAVFSRPTRRPLPDPAWLTAAVVALAEGIYQDRAFDRLPILHDALVEAGCDDADVLGHCKDPDAVHVRGCWVVDLLTGRR